MLKLKPNTERAYRQTNFRYPVAVLNSIDELSAKYGMSKNEVVTQLMTYAIENVDTTDARPAAKDAPKPEPKAPKPEPKAVAPKPETLPAGGLRRRQRVTA